MPQLTIHTHVNVAVNPRCNTNALPLTVNAFRYIKNATLLRETLLSSVLEPAQEPNRYFSLSAKSPWICPWGIRYIHIVIQSANQTG